MPEPVGGPTRRAALVALAGLLLAGGRAAAELRADQAPALVYAAASLADVLAAIARDGGFERLRVSHAASSTLARQILQGAPAQLFISADTEWMDVLERAGQLEPDSRRVLAANRLALVAPGAPASGAPPEDADTLRAALAPVLATPAARIATGDPAHVPVGRYARAALTALGLWDAVAPRLAHADNVRNALALVERGEAPLGIVYRSDALASRRVRLVALFPPASHAPIVYPAAMLRGAGAEARRFHAHLLGPRAQALLRDHGFEPPPAEAPR